MGNALPPEILAATTPAQLEAVRILFREYQEAVNEPVCFVGFQQELDGLPGAYAPPAGRLLLAQRDGEAAGCVALRASAPGICEMKRLYVRPWHRGARVGRLLVEALLGQARAQGYQQLRLDTLPAMHEAVRLYRALGFSEIPPYYEHPVDGALFLALSLR